MRGEKRGAGGFRSPPRVFRLLGESRKVFLLPHQLLGLHSLPGREGRLL